MEQAKKMAISHRKATHEALPKQGKGTILPAWPDRELFTGEAVKDPSGSNSTTIPGQGEPSGSALPRSVRLPRVRHPKTSPKQSSLSARAWRAQKSLDICAFNGGAEREFIAWLTNALQAEPFGAVSIGWLLSNAAFHLDVSIETVKRYLGKYTADLAPFRSDGSMVSLRKPER